MTKEIVLNSKAKKETSLQLVFSRDFQQTASGELKPGSEITILFDAARLPIERSLNEKGKPVWTISAFFQALPAGSVSRIDLAPEKKKTKAAEETVLKGLFTIPEGCAEASIWFLNTGKTGAEYYDSDFGKNYRFPVLPELVETPGVDSAPVKKRRTKRT